MSKSKNVQELVGPFCEERWGYYSWEDREPWRNLPSEGYMESTWRWEVIYRPRLESKFKNSQECLDSLEISKITHVDLPSHRILGRPLSADAISAPSP